MHALAEEGARGKRSAALSAFKADLAEAVARGMGARWVAAGSGWWLHGCGAAHRALFVQCEGCARRCQL